MTLKKFETINIMMTLKNFKAINIMMTLKNVSFLAEARHPVLDADTLPLSYQGLSY